MRRDGRNYDELREIKITPSVSRYAEGSVLIEAGNTKVLCTASAEPNIPRWRQGSGSGWITAEYGMLPRSTHDRMNRERTSNSGRSQEISRLIGRSLRSAVDLKKLGEKQLVVDCDVLQADGGTRTLAITGGFVALTLAFQELLIQGELTQIPLKHCVSAVSVGMIGETPHLDLCYEEDSEADTDMNFVVTQPGGFAEIQGTAEGQPFSHQQLNLMIALANKGCEKLFVYQKEILDKILPKGLL